MGNKLEIENMCMIDNWGLLNQSSVKENMCMADNWGFLGRITVEENMCKVHNNPVVMKVNTDQNYLKSGKYWLEWADKNAPQINDIKTLESNFQSKVIAFKETLEQAGAKVDVRETRRSVKRAYLYHWCWRIAEKKCRAKDATKISGVDIIWDHGNDEDSIKGAKVMESGFRLAPYPRSKIPPSPKSLHIQGEAVDMAIIWVGEIEVKRKDGTKVKIYYNNNPNLNTVLIEVGKSYGVIKNTKDGIHWSKNGK